MFDMPVFAHIPPAGIVMFSIAVMLLAGFLMTRITKLIHVPNVTAYIIAGLLIGPQCLHLMPQNIVNGTDFLSDIALAFIAFGTGEFFKLSTWRKNGGKVIVITVMEAAMASLLIFIVSYWLLGVDLPFAAILAALGSATSPASTLMTIHQMGARGEFVDTLLQVVALDDVVALIEYSMAISIALWIRNGAVNTSIGFRMLGLVISNLTVILLGVIFGWLTNLMMPQRRSIDNRLIIAIALLFLFCGLCTIFGTSPLLGCMSMGITYRNIAHDDKLFKQLNYFNPPILLLFFVRAGASFQLDILFSASPVVGRTPLFTLSVLYFFIRIVGKYLGAYIGCRYVQKPREVRNYLGLALIPQAGVSIGLASMGARVLSGAAGAALQTIILLSSVLYELIGPACAKLALYLSGSYGKNVIPNVREQPDPLFFAAGESPADILAKRILQIEKDLSNRPKQASENELALLAAEEQIEAARRNRQRYKRRF